MIAIVNYSVGNILSVVNALERLGYRYILTDRPQDLQEAEKVILPGVGAAGIAMEHLRRKALDKMIPRLEQPVLGICLGLQLMCAYSEEDNTNCMGIFPNAVKKLPPLDLVPHIGWNNLNARKGKLFKGLTDEDNVYFVHSYAAALNSNTIAVCDYTVSFSAALAHKNFYATQFHPEKSGVVGAAILKNFLEL